MDSDRKIIFIDTLADMGLVKAHYGARVACCATPDSVSFLPLLMEPGVPFLSCLLVTKGEMHLVYAQKDVKVKANELLLVPPHAKVNAITVDDEYALAYLLLDPTYSDSIEGPDKEGVLDGEKTASGNIFPKLYHLDEMKVHELMGIAKQIENAIMIPHLYMKEIMRSLIYVIKVFVAELDSVEEIVPHDFSHKENVFKIFLHLAATHFREYRLTIMPTGYASPTPISHASCERYQERPLTTSSPNCFMTRHAGCFPPRTLRSDKSPLTYISTTSRPSPISSKPKHL